MPHSGVGAGGSLDQPPSGSRAVPSPIDPSPSSITIEECGDIEFKPQSTDDIRRMHEDVFWKGERIGVVSIPKKPEHMHSEVGRKLIEDQIASGRPRWYGTVHAVSHVFGVGPCYTKEELVQNIVMSWRNLEQRHNPSVRRPKEHA